MTVAVGAGIAGLLEATAGYMVTSLATAGKSSWNPLSPGSHSNDDHQKQAEQIVRKALSKIRADLEQQNIVDIWVLSALQEASWQTAVNVQTIADETIPAVRAYASSRAVQARQSAVKIADTRLAATRSRLNTAIARARADAAFGLAHLQAHSDAWSRDLSARITALGGRVTRVQANAIKDANAYTRRIEAKLEVDLKAVRAAAEKYAQNQAALARAYARAQDQLTLKAAKASVASQLADLITKENGDLTRTLAGVWPAFDAEAKALADDLSSDDPAAAADLSAIPDTVPSDDPAAAFAAIAAMTSLIRTTRRCTIPNCRNLSKLGKDLQDLFAALEGAGLLALLAWMIAHPQEAAHDAQTVLGAIVAPIAAGARDLLGVG